MQLIKRHFQDERSEAGETLVETLLSTALVALVVVGFLGAIATTVLGSKVHRQHADENTALVAVMEHLKSPTTVTRVACATTQYNTAAQSALTAHYDSNATAADRRGTLALEIDYQAVDTSGGLSWSDTCAETGSPSLKLQRIKLVLTSFDSAVSPNVYFVKGEN